MSFPADTTPIAGAPAGSSTLGGSTPTHTDHHDALAAGINAVFTELGANPSGSEVDVAARFAALDATVAALPGGDARVFDVVTYGAAVDGVTDDTAAWQDAVDAWAAAGGGEIVSSKSGVSIIAGALQDTAGANAQIVLPAVHVTSGEQMSLVIRGLTPPPADISVIGSVVLPDNHLVLKSTLASGSGAVIGAKGPSGSPGDFTNIHLDVRNLTVRMPSNPTNTALDLRRVATVHLEDVVVDVGTYDVSAITQPTSTGSCGLRLPTINNGARSTVKSVNVVGFYNGVEHSEHAILDDVNAWGCKVAFVPTAANHASRYARVGAYHCERVIKPTGTHYLDVAQLAVEHAASGWLTTDYDVDDAANYLIGNVRWAAVLAGSGPHNSFTVNGGANLTTSRVGAPLSAGGGGGSDYVYRDRLVATIPNTTLTLGATPVANSPLVWVNGAIKWPGTDYTISGAVVTFNSALTAGDVVAVQYHSTSSTAAASALSGGGISITDSFTRADSTSALGTTTTGSKTWVQTAGTWGIATNKAYVSSGTASQVCIAAVDATVADCTIAATFTAGAASNTGLAFRVTDASNFYQVDTHVGGTASIAMFKCVGGAFTAISIPATAAFVSGDVLTVVLLGSSITLKKNGTTFATVTDSTFTTQTKHGMYIEAPTGTSPGGRIDDFSITA